MKKYLLPILALFFLFSCATSQRSILQEKEIENLNSRNRQPYSYIIAPGDRLAIKFFFNASLNDEVIVRPDGNISLQLVDDVKAAGLTTSELDAVLTQKYAQSLKTSGDKYMLSVGDQIQIRSYYNSRMDEKVTIRPDGKISLRLIDEVQAAGKTPSQLDETITEKYAQFFEQHEFSVIPLSFNKPDLSVIVQDFSGQKIYVGGEVVRPGLQEMTGSIHILEAIIQAAGPLNSGDMDRVILIRRGPENKPLVYDINVQNVLSGKSPDVFLQSYDIVYVPKTAIANLEKFLHSYLYNLLPEQVMFSFLYNWNNEVQVQTQ